MTTSSEKKEKSLAEFIVIVALVGILMAVFINFFIKNESQFTQAGLAVIAQSFNTKVNVVHAQWVMDNKPPVVYLTTLHNKQKQAIPVNKLGWINVQNTQLRCEVIWQLIIEKPISEAQLPVSAIDVHISQSKANLKQHSTNSIKKVCRYVLINGSYFQYDPTQGKVTGVRKAGEVSK